MQSSLCACVLIAAALPFALSFKIYWNSPTQLCRKHYGVELEPLLKSYGITVNKGEIYQGDAITIFYEDQLGIYPELLQNGTEINGGIPQQADLSQHLKKAARDIEKIIPNKDFDGLGVIDWEDWRPVWDFNWFPKDIYKHASYEFAKKSQPDLFNEHLERVSKEQFEDSAKLWMLKTLDLAKTMRPKAKWCYYLFPDCYNYKGVESADFRCPDSTIEGNNWLRWLWEASTALCPSIYLSESHLTKYSFEQRVWKENGKLLETMRVASKHTKIFPYVKYFLEERLVPGEDFWRALCQTASIGGDGAVIWGASISVNSKERCLDLKNYITETLGPAAESVLRNYDKCKREVCNDRGGCTWPNDPSVTAWKLFESKNPSFRAVDIVCRCPVEYSGRFCENANK